MSQPSFCLAYGGPGWKKRNKRTVHPTAHEALEWVEVGLEDQGIEYTEPKVCTIWAVTRNQFWAGEATDSRNFEVYVPWMDMKRNKVARGLVRISQTAFHEAVHCIRAEYFPDKSLAEMAATEGIAHCLTDIFAFKTLQDMSFMTAEDIVSSLPEKRLNGLQEQFYTDLSDPSLSYDQVAEWCDIEQPGDLMTAVSLVGTARVSRLIGEGYAYDELIRTPAETIMTAEAA